MGALIGSTGESGASDGCRGVVAMAIAPPSAALADGLSVIAGAAARSRMRSMADAPKASTDRFVAVGPTTPSTVPSGPTTGEPLAVESSDSPRSRSTVKRPSSATAATVPPTMLTRGLSSGTIATAHGCPGDGVAAGRSGTGGAAPSALMIARSPSLVVRPTDSSPPEPSAASERLARSATCASVSTQPASLQPSPRTRGGLSADGLADISTVRNGQGPDWGPAAVTCERYPRGSGRVISIPWASAPAPGVGHQ